MSKLEAKKDKNSKIRQATANALFEGPEVDMASKYAGLIKTIMLTCFYAPPIPFCLIFQIVGIVLLYWSEKYSFFRKYQRPKAMGDHLTFEMVEQLEWSAFLFASGNLLFTYVLERSGSDHSRSYIDYGLVWATFGVTLFQILSPMQVLNEKFFKTKKNLETLTFKEAIKQFDTDYDVENPVTRGRALKKFKKMKDAEENKQRKAKFESMVGSPSLNNAAELQGITVEVLNEQKIPEAIPEQPASKESAGSSSDDDDDDNEMEQFFASNQQIPTLAKIKSSNAESPGKQKGETVQHIIVEPENKVEEKNEYMNDEPKKVEEAPKSIEFQKNVDKSNHEESDYLFTEGILAEPERNNVYGFVEPTSNPSKMSVILQTENKELPVEGNNKIGMEIIKEDEIQLQVEVESKEPGHIEIPQNDIENLKKEEDHEVENQ
jgi:glutaredoxin-related protein